MNVSDTEEELYDSPEPEPTNEYRVNLTTDIVDMCNRREARRALRCIPPNNHICKPFEHIVTLVSFSYAFINL